MRATCLGLATLVVALTMVAPAAAQTEPPLVTKSFYFQCKGQVANGAHVQKVQNSQATITPTWSDVKPTVSFRSGAGCGFADAGSLGGATTMHPTVDATFGGIWDERVKTLNVELHDLLLGQSVAAVNADQLVFKVIVEIDGQVLTPTGGKEVMATQTISPTGLSESVRFGISFKNALPFAGEGRQFRIGINGGYLNANYAWVFDAAEIPAGVEFNPGGGDPKKVVKPTISIDN